MTCYLQKEQEAGILVFQQMSACFENVPSIGLAVSAGKPSNPTSLPLMLFNCCGLLSAASGRCVTLPGALPRP